MPRHGTAKMKKHIYRYDDSNPIERCILAAARLPKNSLSTLASFVLHAMASVNDGLGHPHA
jgi:hypothetical protein